MPSYEPGRINPANQKIPMLLLCLALIAFLVFRPPGTDRGASAEERAWSSDHFDGTLFFNPEGRTPAQSPPGEQPRRSTSAWIWRWIFGSDWQEWPKIKEDTPLGLPAARVPQGSLIITPVGHGTFLIQLDGINILTDPIWSDRGSPVSWAGPKRHRSPGIHFEKLPPIDAVLVSHNHYEIIRDSALLIRRRGLAGPAARKKISNYSGVRSKNGKKARSRIFET